MKLNAVEVTSKDFKITTKFYELLGFKFPDFKSDEQHIEALDIEGSARLMIDSESMIKEISGKDPKPGNHSAFAIEFDSPKEVDDVVKKVKDAGFTVETEPWDAFWGQRYAIVQDPDGYLVDLYAKL